MPPEAETAPAALPPPVGLEACECLTPFGDARATTAALLAGQRALRLHPVLGADGGDHVPLALATATMDEAPADPRWLGPLRKLVAQIPAHPWGTERFPVFVTSSNFAVGGMYAFARTQQAEFLAFGTPGACVDRLAQTFGWGPHVSTISHACVSAHLGLSEAARRLAAGWAERALVLTFDFLSPFVCGGFHALKILNDLMPAPYADRATGAIGLGDGAAFAVLSRQRSDFQLEAFSSHNEMHHFTANRADGAGFRALAEPLRAAVQGRRVWVKGHGTGTLEAGRLEASSWAAAFPGAPLVGWKGSLGHTLGSCGLVELAIAVEAVRGGRAPGTVGSTAPCFTPEVAVDPFATDAFDGAVLASNAFGGAHAACLLTHG